MSLEYASVRCDWIRHPKVLDLPLTARGLWITGLCWAGAGDTDGFIPDAAMRQLTSTGDLREISASCKHLVAKKLWDRREDGYQIHDWHEHAAWLVNRKNRDRERQRRRREGLALSRDESKVSRDAGVTVTPERRTVNSEHEQLTPKPPQGDVLAVWQAWLDSTGRTACKLDEKRARLIRARLANYPLDDVRDAVRGWERDPWDGRRQQNGIEILLRDGAHLEKFRDLWRQPVVTKPSEPQSTGELARLETMQRGISERNDPALAGVIAAISAKMRPPEEAFG